MSVHPVGADGAPAKASMMDSYLTGDGLIMSQKTSECCRFFICQPNIDWTLHNYTEDVAIGEVQVPQKMYVKEEAPYCERVWSCYAPGCRSTHYTQTDSANGAVVMYHKKDMTCGQNSIVCCDDQGNTIRCPMCCCLPYLETYDGAGTLLGRSQYIQDMYLCVPKLETRDAQGNLVYEVRPDTCCGGCIPMFTCKGRGAKCFKIPFYVRKPGTREKLQATRGASSTPAQIACGQCATVMAIAGGTVPGTIIACPKCQAQIAVPAVAAAQNGSSDENYAQISDLWAGLKREICSKRNLYGIKWPADATTEQKATLIGMTLLIDIALYEQDND